MSEQVRATLHVEGSPEVTLVGRWGETAFSVGERTTRLHCNPDGSGFVEHLIDGKRQSLSSWLRPAVVEALQSKSTAD